MVRHLAIALGLAALTLPAAAQEHAYDYQDESGSAWSDEPAPPGEGAYSEYPADEARPQVDVNVDIATPDASVTFDTFRDGLSPYGEWINVPNYGHVWRPAHVAAGWRPYYYGRWEWTDEGWLWASDEPWGWAAYHYGRWSYEPYYGWVWVPGYQWAPAWVTWRYSPDYIGWAPLAPGFSVYVSTYPVAVSWWTFVPCGRFVGAPVYASAVPYGRIGGIYHASVAAPPRARVFGAVAPAWGGPARPFVERTVGRPITPVRVQPVGSPSAVRGAARPGVVPIYRPEVRSAPAGRPSVMAPARPWGAAPGRASVVPAPRSGAPEPRAGGVPSRPGAPVPGQGAFRQPPGGSFSPPSPRGGGERGTGGNFSSPSPRGSGERAGERGPGPGPRQMQPGSRPQQFAPASPGSRPQQFAPAPRQGPPTSNPRMVAPSAPSGRFAPVTRPQQFQGGGNFHSGAQAQAGGGFHGGGPAQGGGGFHGGGSGGAPAQHGGGGGHAGPPGHGGGHR